MTEAGPVLAMCLAFAKEPFEVKSGSCGTVVRNAELKIVDPDTGASLGRNLPGEICIRGEQIMKGPLLSSLPPPRPPPVFFSTDGDRLCDRAVLGLFPAGLLSHCVYLK